MSQTAGSCLLKLGACGRLPGQATCPKCGLDEKAVYPSQSDLNEAVSSAVHRYQSVEVDEGLKREAQHRMQATDANRTLEKLRKQQEKLGDALANEQGALDLDGKELTRLKQELADEEEACRQIEEEITSVQLIPVIKKLLDVKAQHQAKKKKLIEWVVIGISCVVIASTLAWQKTDKTELQRHVEAGVSQAKQSTEQDLRATLGDTAQSKPTPPRLSFEPEMVVIPADSFTMGSSPAEQERAKKGGLTKEQTDREGLQRNVSIRRFELSKHEVTVGQWRAFAASGYTTEAERNTGGANGCYALDEKDGKWDWREGRNWKNPGWPLQDNQPVECISWNDAQAYINWLNQQTMKGYRLPSEAEWEYAARTGSKERYSWGDDTDHTQQCQFANGTDQTPFPGGGTWSSNAACNDRHFYVAPVGSYRANAFGLHDMHGNVWEWVQDCFEDNYSKGQPTDGSAHRGNDSNCSRRVLRGGSWSTNPDVLRSAFRDWLSPDYRGNGSGFRLARTVP